MASSITLRRVTPEEVPELAKGTEPVDPKTREGAVLIVEDVKRNGVEAVRKYGLKFGDLKEGDPLVIKRPQLQAAYEALPGAQQKLLVRTADRIRAFAEAQRSSVREVRVPIPGGWACQKVAAVEYAGCYAPGGRFPLPSSVLMTAVTAVAAGVKNVVVASPKPAQITLAAAHVAGASALLAVGGAHAIAALAYGAGADVHPCDAIVGPGNRWVTAAKQLVAGRVTIDMLAGPSELLVLADDTADPATVAADLLAQAEHDVVAVPMLVTTCEKLVQQVEEELRIQLEKLSTKATASASVKHGGIAVVCEDMGTAIKCANYLAPEHLEIITRNDEKVAEQLEHYGALFVGNNAAEVLGDYGAGPNHTLPTGRTARSTGGLSVFDFLRVRTWMKLNDIEKAQQLVVDSMALAKLEGLHAHAKSAGHRLIRSSL